MLVGGHPVAGVEAGEIDGVRKSTQRTLPAEIEVDVEITQGQFAQSAIDGLAVAASGVVGFGDGSPMAFDAVDGYHVVGIVLGFEVEDQRRIAVGAQGGSSQSG